MIDGRRLISSAVQRSFLSRSKSRSSLSTTFSHHRRFSSSIQYPLLLFLIDSSQFISASILTSSNYIPIRPLPRLFHPWSRSNLSRPSCSGRSIPSAAETGPFSCFLCCPAGSFLLLSSSSSTKVTHYFPTYSSYFYFPTCPRSQRRSQFYKFPRIFNLLHLLPGLTC